MNMNNKAIGVFDSGVGGLSCVPAIAKLLPKEKIIYFGDTARAPYGSRSDAEIKAFSVETAEKLAAKGCKALAIACNTISCIALDDIKGRLPGIPVIGIIEPAAELIAKSCAGKRTGLIATEATVRSGTYTRALKSLGGEVPELLAKPCPSFVPMIEAGRINEAAMDECIRLEIDEFIALNGIEALVLGCTHFPFIKGNIQRLYPGLELIDPADALAEKTAAVLRDNGLLAASRCGDNEFTASDESPVFKDMAERIANQARMML